MRLLAKIGAGLGILIGVLIILAGAGLGWLVLDGRKARETGATYVALGSSFAAGPGVGTPARDAPKLCGQSNDNFAHLLARQRGLVLLDRSCGGSTTADILTHGQLFQSPQIAAVNDRTRLVTITTGGNDLGYLGGMWFASCQQNPQPVPWWLKSACKARPSPSPEAKMQALARSMDAVAKAVRQRAPEATLVFIDYTTVLPETGGCAARLPLTEAQLSQFRTLSRELSTLTARVARENEAILIPASDLTRGHDVCAPDPWVFGWAFPKKIFGAGPMAYHPKDQAMAAIARALDANVPKD